MARLTRQELRDAILRIKESNPRTSDQKTYKQMEIRAYLKNTAKLHDDDAENFANAFMEYGWNASGFNEVFEKLMTLLAVDMERELREEGVAPGGEIVVDPPAESFTETRGGKLYLKREQPGVITRILDRLKPVPRPAPRPVAPVSFTPSQLHNELWMRAADQKEMQDFITNIFTKLNENEQVREKEIEQFTSMFNHARLDGVSERNFKAMAAAMANYLQRYRAIEPDQPGEKQGFFARKLEQAKQMRADDAQSAADKLRAGQQARDDKQRLKDEKRRQKEMDRAARGSGTRTPFWEGGAAEEQPSRFKSFLLFALIVGFAVFLVIDQYLSAAGLLAVVILWMFISSQLRREFFSWNGLFFLLTFVVHIFFFKANFSYGVAEITLLLLVYVGWLVYVLLFNPERATQLKTSLIIIALMLVFYALPALLVKFGIGDTVRQTTIYLVAILPIASLYLLHRISMQNEDGYADGFWFWYKLFGIALPLIILLFTGVFEIAEMIPAFRFEGDDAKTGFMGFLNMLKTSSSQAFDRATTAYDRATDPGAYYTGRVEQNKKDPLGVTLENFRPQDRTINNGSDIIMHGLVKAKSFLGTSLPIQPSCLIDRKGAPEAEVDPPVTEVVFGSSQAFTCTFPNMTTGSYSVKGAATFPFETWSYISYTFVDDERVRNLARQGLDVNTEFDIPEEPTAIFTSGPIKVGMGGSSMPILVRSEEPLLQPGTKIGITVDPAWEAGRLQRVERIELKVPEPFSLVSCDRDLSQPPQQDIYDAAYTTYTFMNPEFGPVVTYTSVTCSLNITDPDAARSLVRENDKAVRSFIAVVKYTYTVEQTAVVQVK